MSQILPALRYIIIHAFSLCVYLLLCVVLCGAVFSKVHHAVYDSIEAGGAYQSLRSTQHFGGLVWYLVQHEKMVGLVKDMVERSL